MEFTSPCSQSQPPIRTTRGGRRNRGPKAPALWGKEPLPHPIFALGTLRFGTSGWSYDEWLGVFYETASESKLDAYAKVFNTAEIDSSFYRAPTKGMVLGWLRYTPEDFVFAAKVPQTVTHDRPVDVGKRARGAL